MRRPTGCPPERRPVRVPGSGMTRDDVRRQRATTTSSQSPTCRRTRCTCSTTATNSTYTGYDAGTAKIVAGGERRVLPNDARDQSTDVLQRRHRRRRAGRRQRRRARVRILRRPAAADMACRQGGHELPRRGRGRPTVQSQRSTALAAFAAGENCIFTFDGVTPLAAAAGARRPGQRARQADGGAS